MKKLKQWFRKKILKRDYFIGIDIARSKDYGCEVCGYVNHRTRHIVITKINYLPDIKDESRGSDE